MVRDENEVDGIIAAAHLRSDGVHRGINVTSGNVAARYYWNNIRSDVIEYVSSEICSSSQLDFVRIMTNLGALPICDLPRNKRSLT